MQSSEMTDEQLRLAIAELLPFPEHDKTPACREKWDDKYAHACAYLCECGFFRSIPDYPNDPAAALGLPLETNNEKRKFAIELSKIVIPDVNIGIAAIVYEARFATARQHSEAWLIARRNDGNK